MQRRLTLTIVLLCYVFYSQAAHGQRWNILGRTYEVESIWVDETLNKETHAQVNLVRSDLIKRNQGVKIKLISDNSGMQFGSNTQAPHTPLAVQLSVYDRNQKTFHQQYDQQALPSAVGQTEVIKMSEFWGAQNYGPILFHFSDGLGDTQSKILIVQSGGKQKTKEKLKERLKAGIEHLKALSDGESSDLSPPSHDASSDGESADYLTQQQRREEEILKIVQAKQLEELKLKQAKQLEQFQKNMQEMQRREHEAHLNLGRQLRNGDQLPEPVEHNNYNEPTEDIWETSELFCPAAPLKFIDMLQEDWFTPHEYGQSIAPHSDFDLLDGGEGQQKNNEKKRKLEDGPQVQDSMDGEDRKPEIKSEVDASFLVEEELFDFEDYKDLPPSKKLRL